MINDQLLLNVPATLADLYASVYPPAVARIDRTFALPDNVRASYQDRWCYRLILTTRTGREYACSINVQTPISKTAIHLSNGWLDWHPYDGQHITGGRIRHQKIQIHVVDR